MMKKLGIYSQWRSELSLIVIFLVLIEGGSMNVPRLWNLLRTYRRCEVFFSAVGNCFHVCQLKNKESLGYFKGLSHDEGQADFAKKTPRLSILLGPPGRAQVFPYLSPGPLDLWWYAKMNKPHVSRN